MVCFGYQDVFFFSLSFWFIYLAALVLVVAHGIFHHSVQILWLWHACSVVGAQGPSCFEACGILVPWPGIEPTSPALQGGFLITRPPGMSLTFFLLPFNFILEYSAWRIPWTEEPGELQSIGSQRVRQDWGNIACTHTVDWRCCDTFKCVAKWFSYTYTCFWSFSGLPWKLSGKEPTC